MFNAIYESFSQNENSAIELINTGNSKSPGYHWVGVVTTDSNIYLFDSFHRDPDSIFNTIEKFQEDRQVIVSKWKDPIQKNTPEDANICGQLSLAWLLTVQHFGIRNAIQI